MKRFLCILLAMVVLMTVVVPVMAAANEAAVTPRYSYIQTIQSSMSIGSLGLSSCGVACVVYGGSSIKVTAALQQYNGSSWTTIKTWTTTSTTTSAGLNKNYAVPKGYTYRVRASCGVYNANGTLLESGYIYSNQVVY